jgi:hypothetical protein
MKSPFKMTPGRGDLPKTGRGINPALMGKSPMKQTDIELTKSYDEGKRKAEVARAKPEVKKNVEKTLGVTINAATGETVAKKRENRVIKSGTNYREVNSEGKVVKEVRANPNSSTGGRAAEALKKEVENKNTDTNTRRKSNAELINTIGGGTPADRLDEKGKQTLVNMRKAVVVPSPAKQKVTKKPPTKMKKC